MKEEQRYHLRALMSGRIADACLLAALLSVLAISWHSAPRSTAVGLQHAAREAVARQLGASSAHKALPKTATVQAAEQPTRARDGMVLLHQASKQAPAEN